MDFYQNLKSICDSKGTSVSSVLTQCNLSKSYGTNWKKGVSPNLDVLTILSKNLDVSLDYLVLGKEASLTPEEQRLVINFSSLNYENKIRTLERIETLLEIQKSKNKPEIKMIPIKQNINRVSAGKGYNLENEDWKDIEVPLTQESRKADYCLIIDGDSMEPEFHNGDTVLIREQPAVEIGQICIYTIGNQGFIKKFGGDRLISLNEDKEKYPDILFSEHASDYIRCNGLVIGRV